MMRRHSVICVAMGLVLVAGCGGSKPYVRPGFMDHPPRRVAVLPFRITYPYDLAEGQAIPASHLVGRDVLRKTFYYALTPYGYEDVKLAEVDRRLAERWGPIESGTWQQATAQELGEVVGADALVFGELHRLVYVSTPMVTEASLDGSLRLVEASSGEVLWRQDVKAAERGGALFKKGQVVDFLKDQVRSFNPRVKFLRVADQAVTGALKGFPNPPLETTAELPTPGREADGAAAPRLALLPIAAKHANWQQAAKTVRQLLASSLQESPFEVLEIQRVNAALERHGWTEGQGLPPGLSLPALADELGADALLRGTVTNWGRTYLVVQSWVKAELDLALVDASSGDVIWTEKRRNSRQAGILKGPTGYKSLATAPIMGMKTSNLERVATHLTRNMVEDLNRSPAVLTYVSERHD